MLLLAYSIFIDVPFLLRLACDNCTSLREYLSPIWSMFGKFLFACYEEAPDMLLCLSCSRAFYDKRISQEVSGDALGEVSHLQLNRKTDGNIMFNSCVLCGRNSKDMFLRSWEDATSRGSP